jgi:hypothetical protein
MRKELNPLRPLVLGTLLLWTAVLGCQDATTKATTKAAPTAAEVPTGPRLVVDSASYDLGDVDFAQPYPHSFKVKNAGGTPLRLKVARKSCTCAEVVAPAEAVEPGKEDKVTVTWVPIPGQAGSHTLSAELETNDPQKPLLRLELKAHVTPTVRIAPEDWSMIDFGQLRPGEVQQREIKVFSTVLPEFDLEPSVSHTGLKATVTPLPPGSDVGGLKARCGYGVTVRTSNELPKGYFRETLTLTVRGKQERRIVLPVYGDIETGAVLVSPREVEFKRPYVTDADTQKVHVQFIVPSDKESVEVASWEPNFLVVGKPQPVKKGLWEFTVSIPRDNPEAVKYQAGGFLEGRILLRTSSANAAEVPIRVKWIRPDT